MVQPNQMLYASKMWEWHSRMMCACSLFFTQMLFVQELLPLQNNFRGLEMSSPCFTVLSSVSEGGRGKEEPQQINILPHPRTLTSSQSTVYCTVLQVVWETIYFHEAMCISNSWMVSFLFVLGPQMSNVLIHNSGNQLCNSNKRIYYLISWYLLDKLLLIG